MVREKKVVREMEREGEKEGRKREKERRMGIDMEVSKTVLGLMKKQGMDIKLNTKVICGW